MKRSIGFKTFFLDVALLFLLLIIIFSVASRFSPLSPMGFSIVASNSMLPYLRPGDLVIYVSRYLSGYSYGDVVIWCSSPSLCVVHRLLNISRDMIITRGDANLYEDNPVPISMLRGRVITSIPREIWIPLAGAPTIYMLIRRIRIVDSVEVAAIVFLANLLLSLFTVLMISGPAISPPPTQPSIYLSTYSIDTDTCRASITYTGDMVLLNARVYVNGSPVNASISPSRIDFTLDHILLSKAYIGGGYIEVSVEANLSRLGFLRGSYIWRVFGSPPSIAINGSGVEISNKNCFPLYVNITYLYAYKSGELWSYRSTEVEVPGKGSVFVEAPNASYVYVDIKYRAMGVEYWERRQIR